MTKVCTGCGLEKPVDDFYLDKRWGCRRSRCKTCCTAYSSTRPKPKLDPEKSKARRARWEEKNPEWRRTYDREYHQAHPEKFNHPRRKGGAQYERVRADKNRRRARLAGAEGSHTVEEWIALREQYEHRCLSCGRDDRPLTRDHVVPLIEGGSDYIDNIQPLCKPCNSSKGTSMIDFRSSNDTCEVQL